MTHQPQVAAVRVLCQVRVPPDCGNLAGAVLRVSLEDISLADARALRIVEVDKSLSDARDLNEPVELQAHLTAGRDYSLRAHVSRSGHTQVEDGDLITTSSYPVAAVAGTVSANLTLVTV